MLATSGGGKKQLYTNDLQKWFEKQAKHDDNVVLLEDALLGNRFWKYALYRLRFFAPRLAAESLFHLVKVVLLYSVFSQNEFVDIVLVYAAVGFVSSFWWGSLETMRGNIRSLYRSGRSYQIPKEIGRWLSLSIQLATMTMAVAITLLLLGFANGEKEYGPSDLYTFSVVFSLSLNFVLRCYHSGIYSIRRIYRPFGAIIGIEALSFISLLALWPWIGSWSLPTAAIISSMSAAAATFHYTRRSYRFLGFQPSQFVRIWWPLGSREKKKKRKRRKRLLRPSAASLTSSFIFLPSNIRIKETFSSGLSYALMSMDALLVIVLFAAGNVSNRFDNAIEIFTLFFIVAPAIRAGVDWSHLFYFDLKRLEVKLFRNLRRQFERRVFKLALIMAVASWALGSLMATAVYQRSLDELYVMMLPFFLSSSLLAAAQTSAFSAKTYARLVKSGIFLMAGVVVVGFLVEGTYEKIFLLSIVIFSALAMLKGWQGGLARRIGENNAGRSQDGSSGGEDSGRKDLLWPTEWLGNVRNAKQPVRISVLRTFVSDDDTQGGKRRHGYTRGQQMTKARIGDSSYDWKHRQVARQIASKLGDSGGVCLISPDKLALYKVATDEKEDDNSGGGGGGWWPVSQSGGMVQIIGDTEIQSDGVRALEVACSMNLLGCDIQKAWAARNEKPLYGSDVQKEFEQIFPSGITFDPKRPVPVCLNKMSSKERRQIMFNAAMFARDFNRNSRSRIVKNSSFHVTAFCKGGELEQIFLVNKQQADYRLISDWQRQIKQYNLRAALS